MSGGRKVKTEHCGAKHGCGAYWGPKAVAKRASRKLRRERDRREAESMSQESAG